MTFPRAGELQAIGFTKQHVPRTGLVYYGGMKPNNKVSLDPTQRAYNPRYVNETGRTRFPMYAGGSGYVLSYALVARLSTIKITDTSPLPFRHFPREDATVRSSNPQPRPSLRTHLLPTRRLCHHTTSPPRGRSVLGWTGSEERGSSATCRASGRGYSPIHRPAHPEGHPEATTNPRLTRRNSWI